MVAGVLVGLSGCTPFVVSSDSVPEVDTADTAAPVLVAVSRELHTDRMGALWLGASVGAWTGQQTEGQYTEPPFLTDADPLDLVLDPAPWPLTAETDREYLYHSLLWTSGALSADTIQDGWLEFLSGPLSSPADNARELMAEGVSPEVTGLGALNPAVLLGDGQRSVESLGALTPGRVDLALLLADPAIRATADGYAEHAAQFLVALHALAPIAPAASAPSEQIRWLIREGRKVVPDSSRTADVIDQVLALAEERRSWEESRDAVFIRYQRDASKHGFVSRGWQDSNINLAATLIALLHSDGDPARAIHIAARAGWDADANAATAGGLLGQLVGRAALLSSLGVEIDDTLATGSTLAGLPDYLPAGEGTDSAELLATRTLPLIDALIDASGGTATADSWLVEPWDAEADEQLWANPGVQRYRSSARYRVASAGGIAAVVSSVLSSPPQGTSSPEVLINGSEVDASGVEVSAMSEAGCFTSSAAQACFSTEDASATELAEGVTLTVRYDRSVVIDEVVFWEGYHRDGQGGFASAEAWVELEEGWVSIGESPTPALSEEPFQVLTWALPAPAEVTGIRVAGPVSGFLTGLELDGFLSR